MQSWESLKGQWRHIADEKAFVFSIDNKKIYKVVEPKNALFCSSNEGPGFGRRFLEIESDPMNIKDGC